MTIAKQLELIAHNIDPQTGEIFNISELSEDKQALYSLQLLAFKLGVSKTKPSSINALNRPSDQIFTDLKAWRRNESIEQNVPAFVIFSDTELWQIAEGDVVEPEDLLYVKGINSVKFERYSEAVYEILKQYM